jgi:two-component system, NtrC family, sensor kinase
MNRNSLPVYFFLLLFASTLSFGQKREADSIKKLLAQNQSDTSRVLLLVRLSNAYNFYLPDSAIILAQEAVQDAQRLHFARGEARALNVLGSVLRLQGELPQSLETCIKALQISRTIHDRESEARSLIFIGVVYSQLSEFRQALSYFQQAREITEHFPQTDILFLTNIGNTYERMNRLDSALYFEKQAYAMLKDLPRSTLGSLVMTSLGIIEARLGNNSVALGYYRDALENSYITGDLLNRGRVQYRIAELYNQLHQPDSSLFYARLSFVNSQRASSQLSQLNASNLLVKLYEANGNPDSAFHYQQIAMALKDSLFGPEKFQRLQMFALTEQQRQQEILQTQADFKNKIKLYALLATLGVFLLLAAILYRNNRQKQKANALLHDQKTEIQNALTELKSTQSQLIQSEKMASLGELTAGIAHEIQNPLNFVNNFSEVNTELIEELKSEKSKVKSERNEELEDEILDDIKQNLEKILHHGKRADAIVKGMLQHSRASTGKKEPTDINALADEYLRLSYHGMRAKDKSFNATLKTDFDNSIGKINVVPQDIGRVLLNLFNNAFYAVSERRASTSLSAEQAGSAEQKYEPTISLCAKRTNSPSGDGGIEIHVKDNGIGIPQKVVDKIFQPFFTTKPTGQGTGLGLSLSYDIVKAHGGEIKVNTKEGEGSEFIVQLPV